MRFKNLKTGNIVSTENKETIALMKNSDNYKEITAKKAKDKEKADETATSGNTETE